MWQNNSRSRSAIKPKGNLAGSCKILILGVMLGGIGALPANAQSCAKMMDVRIQEWTGDIINIVPWVADAEGLFSKHCVDVTLVPLVSGPGSYSAMVSGTIDFASGAP